MESQNADRNWMWQQAFCHNVIMGIDVEYFSVLDDNCDIEASNEY